MAKNTKRGAQHDKSLPSLTTTCPHCKKDNPKNTKYCNHCGYNLLDTNKRTRVYTCPNCKGVITSFSRYCNHCGADIHTFTHARSVKTLMYLILIVIIALTLFLFFGPVYIGETPTTQVTPQIEPFLAISNAACEWTGTTYRVCETITWSGNLGDHVTCSFQDGKDADQSGRYVDSPFTCCSDVTPQPGLKLARAHMYTKDNTLITEDSTSTTCTSQQPPAPFAELQETSTEAKKFWFAARTTSQRRGYGTETITFDNIVNSCEFTGNYYLNNRNFKQQTGYCDTATGTFSGYADANQQYVTTDPAEFRWAGGTRPLINPLPETYNGYSLFFWTCDPKFFTTPTYKVDGELTGFGTKTLQLTWNYRNEETQPQAEIFYELACTTRA